MDVQNSEKNQPLSLRWKWGILLYLSFSFLSILAVIIQHQLVIYDYKVNHYRTHQEIFDQLLEKFEDYQVEFNLETFHDKDNLPDSYALETLRFLTDENTIIRVYNPKQQLVYQSQRMDIPLQMAMVDISPYSYKGRNYFLGQKNLRRKDTKALVGTVQYILLPETVQAFVKDQEAKNLQLLLFLLVISVLISYLITKYFLQRLDYLNDILDLVEEENLSEMRVKLPDHNDEWSDLSLHINRMLDKIDLYVRNQKQFVEDVSHELRTPVAIVEGHLKILDRWGKDDPQILEESISASLQEISRMRGLVQEMLDLSRADHANVDYKDEVTEVLTTTRQVFQNFKIIHEDFDFFMDIEKTDDEINVRIFKNHFEQILIILMDNAVKYSKDRKEIHLSLSQQLNRVEIAVQDFGEGMNDEDKHKVFERFYRVDKARSRDKGGNGLGLSIAKQLVEGYRGEIRVESVLDHGSIFYVNFPVVTDSWVLRKTKKNKALMDYYQINRDNIQSQKEFQAIVTQNQENP